MIVFVLDSVKDTDFYKKNRIVTTDSRFVELATKFQALDYLALVYFSSCCSSLSQFTYFLFSSGGSGSKWMSFEKTRYDIVNYRIVRVTVNDDMKGEVKKSPLKTFKDYFNRLQLRTRERRTKKH